MILHKADVSAQTQTLLCLQGIQSFCPWSFLQTTAIKSHRVYCPGSPKTCNAQSPQAFFCHQAVTVVGYQVILPKDCTEGACASSKHASEKKQDCAYNIVVVYVQCCFMGQVYRHAMRIHNRGSSAMKATLSLPPSVHPFLQAQPTTGFCQVCSIQLTCHTQQLAVEQNMFHLHSAIASNTLPSAHKGRFCEHAG